MHFKRTTLIISSFLLFGLIILQSHSDGRATRGRDNTGAPGGQGGGNGPISCINCHNGADFEVSLNLELLDADSNAVEEYMPNQIYTARVTIETVSGIDPAGYGFQMVSLIDQDDSDVNGWMDGAHSPNVQLTPIEDLERVFAEHDGGSDTNEFTAEWQAPDENSGDISFYIAGIGTNDNGGSSGDYAPDPIKVTFSELTSSSTADLNQGIGLEVYPNPARDFVEIIVQDERDYAVKLYDFSGRTLMEAFNSTQLAVSNLPNGLYFVEVKSLDSNRRVVEKVMIVK